ncbi:cytochrome P450 [Thamnocephalis sphaerospora]|uniref:Cytochrome P450 n=1 Tax=Thamnocephalis sphaerospora TaxID=78915 RepID=A0A4P9XRK5_9FUNG|nr:cytochrome P450 [Thamnocephalis sphaerospora]|eukprot:RKP08723.1 cytochrome P450 [Thamnocephalis sphaerospora]
MSGFQNLFPVRSVGRLPLLLAATARKHHHILDSIILPEIARRRAAAEKDPKFIPPKDLLQLFCDSSTPEGIKEAPRDVISYIMFVTTVSTFDVALPATNFLYDIASHPKVREKIYQEQQQIIARHGTAFSKEALRDMTYLDACLRETLRLHADAVIVARTAMRDVTLSNGTCIPKGRFCFMHVRAFNRAPKFHKNADEYLPDRTADLPSQRAVTRSPGYVTFGLGRRACPGRFLAVDMLKSLAAWLLRNYDFTIEPGQHTADGTYGSSDHLSAPRPILFTPRDPKSVSST